jgi:hypothetical protein
MYGIILRSSRVNLLLLVQSKLGGYRALLSRLFHSRCLATGLYATRSSPKHDSVLCSIPDFRKDVLNLRNQI